MCERRKNTIPLLKLRDIQNQRRGDEGQEDEWRGKKRNGKKRLKKKKKKKGKGGKKSRTIAASCWHKPHERCNVCARICV